MINNNKSYVKHSGWKYKQIGKYFKEHDSSFQIGV